MESVAPFADVLEAAGRLSLEEQETLVDILGRRVIAERRRELAAAVRQANEEFQAGACVPATPADLVREILS